MTQFETDLANMGVQGTITWAHNNLVGKSAAQIKTAVESALPREAAWKIQLGDPTYWTATPAQLTELAACVTCLPPNVPWIFNSMDCDKWVRIWRGWLASVGLGNLAIAEYAYSAYDANNGFVINHMVALAVDTNLQCHLIGYPNKVPQAQARFPITMNTLGGYPNVTSKKSLFANF